MKTKTIYMLLILFSTLFFSCKNNQSESVNDPEPNHSTQENRLNAPTVNPGVTAESSQLVEDLSGNVQIINVEQFHQKVTDTQNEKGIQFKGSTPVLVDFYADWCRPCIALNPIIVELAKKYQGKIIVYKVNVDKAQELASFFNVESIPTLMFFKKNTQPTKMVGAPSKMELEKAIQDLLL
ncbi:MAG: thioredoxin [Bacteroidales bacterium]|jgi:thioredoxin|nr:thioredoxin [Bacteroidales bacterium]